MSEHAAENDVPREYAQTEDEKCWREECWLLDGHNGLHAYRPSVFGADGRPGQTRHIPPEMTEGGQS